MTDAWEGPARALAERIVAFVDGSLASAAPEPFEGLTLDIHAYQVRHDPVMASLVDGPVHSLEDLPFVPVGLFKEVSVGTVPQDEALIRFRTSGTTGVRRGVHAMRSDALVVHQARRWAQCCVPGLQDLRTVALLEDAPDSSLAHMVRHLASAGSWHVRAGVLDRGGLADALRADGCFVPTTGFSLAAWLANDEVAPLPPGSVLMVTGGFKGREVGLDGDELLARARERLRPARLVVEYGMTELSSQLWGTPEARLLAPPWLRVVAVDADGRGVAAGQAGQLRFIDLCNLDAAVAIETMDQGVLHADGTLTLLGRLPEADLRGCSLPYEGLLR